MSKILVMTDPHITSADKHIIGMDSFSRLSQAISHAATHQADADHLVIMGDLTHYGTEAEYERIQKLVSALPWPTTLMLGNHDNRSAFRQQFPTHPTDPNGFVQCAVDLPDVRLITLDSLDEHAVVKHSGRLCEKRIAFLQNALDTADRPCLVFVHHTPFKTGFSGMDAINLQNASELRDVLADSPTKHLFAGHIHRTITATIDGLSITTFKSTCHQMPMMLGREGSGHSVDEPGAYGIVLTSGSDVVVHFEDFSLPSAATQEDHASG